MDHNNRKNTLSFDFVDVKYKMTFTELHMFLKNEANLKVEDVIAIQINGNKMLVKIADHLLIDEIIENTSGTIIYKGTDDNTYNIYIERADKFTIVRMHNIEYEIEDIMIQNCLQGYGSVIAIKRETWGKDMPFPVYNGTRSIKMILKKEIPSYIPMSGRKVWVSYTNQKKTCRFCDGNDHLVQDCPTKISNRISNNISRSYAAIAGNKTVPDNVFPIESTNKEESGVKYRMFPPLMNKNSQYSAIPNNVTQGISTPITDEPFVIVNNNDNLSKTPIITNDNKRKMTESSSNEGTSVNSEMEENVSDNSTTPKMETVLEKKEKRINKRQKRQLKSLSKTIEGKDNTS